MKSILYIVLGFMLGFVAAQTAYSRIYNPEHMAAEAIQMAIQSYYVGCMDGPSTALECKLATEKFRQGLLRI